MPSLIPLDPTTPIVFAPISNGEWRFRTARQEMEALWRWRHLCPRSYPAMRRALLDELTTARRRWMEDPHA